VTETADIRNSLETELLNVTDAPSNIGWSNFNFDPVTDEMNLVTNFIVSLQEGDTLGTRKRLIHRGLFTCDIYAPEDVGPNASDTLADNIRAYFYPGRDLTPVNGITTRIQSSKRGQGVNDSPFFFTKVTINWFAHTLLDP